MREIEYPAKKKTHMKHLWDTYESESESETVKKHLRNNQKQLRNN